MNRRSFLGSILALGAAPAIVRADALMRIVPRETGIFLGVDVGVYDGVVISRFSLFHPRARKLYALGLFNAANANIRRVALSDLKLKGLDE